MAQVYNALSFSCDSDLRWKSIQFLEKGDLDDEYYAMESSLCSSDDSSVSSESNEGQPNERDIALGLAERHGRPQSPVQGNVADHERPPPRLITPERQPTFFKSPNMEDLEDQIDRTAMRFRESMRQSDQTRTRIKMPRGASNNFGENGKFGLENQQQGFVEFTETRFLIYQMLGPRNH